jgi:ATP-dependent protease ClpP protease subunit
MARRKGLLAMLLAADQPTGGREGGGGGAAPQARQWFRIANRAGVGTVSNAATRIDIYEEIGGWGANAADFVAQLRGVDTPEIELHVNSPGGSVFDGVAIYNSLVQHPATVTAYVDGLAASAASFIVQAADEIVMNPGSMMMVHDAIGMTWGNASDHTLMAGLLAQVSDSIADLYAARAGGTAAQWRAVMEQNAGEGQWYTADQAVTAGLADRVAGQPEGDAEPAADQLSTGVDSPVDKFDRSSIAAGHRLVLAQRDAALQVPVVVSEETLADAMGLPAGVRPYWVEESTPLTSAGALPVGWI